MWDTLGSLPSVDNTRSSLLKRHASSMTTGFGDITKTKMSLLQRALAQ